ncbi:hypothetical protein J3E69DRAFT_266289 [Trichoderma sp. SZMC 28015]
MGRTGHGNEQEREHCIDSLPLSEKGVTWPSVGCQLRQWSFKELPHEHQHQHQQPDELLPPVCSRLGDCSLGLSPRGYWRRIMRSEPVILGRISGGFFGVVLFPSCIFSIKRTLVVYARPCSFLSPPGFVGRICKCAVSVSAVDGPILATDAILNLASSYSMVARPGDVRALVNIATEKYLRSSFPVVVEMAEKSWRQEPPGGCCKMPPSSSVTIS